MDSLLKGAVFIGAIAGQATMGFVGDYIGIELAMLCTHVISLLGIFGCIIAPFISHESSVVYTIISVSRGILGFGAGGKYPLASGMRANTADDYDSDSDSVLDSSLHSDDDNEKTNNSSQSAFLLTAQAVYPEDEEEHNLEVLPSKQQKKIHNNNNNNISQYHRAKEVSKSFFYQTPGAISPFINSYLLLLSFRESFMIQYVILVAFGGIPSFFALYFTWLDSSPLQQKKDYVVCGTSQNKVLQSSSSASNTTSKTDIVVANNTKSFDFEDPYQTEKNTAQKEKINTSEHNRKLLGTGLSWALYDFIYYGTALNLPEIMGILTQHSDSGDQSSSSYDSDSSQTRIVYNALIQNSLKNAFVATMGIPGVLFAIYAIEPIGGLKPLQGWGFILIGISCAGINITYKASVSANMNGNEVRESIFQWASFLFCCLLIFSLNWGCNVSTYVLPIEIFPKKIRSSFHGLAACSGKVGALIGSLCFTFLNKTSSGISVTFFVCSLFSFIGLFVTWVFIDPPYKNLLR